MRNLPVLSGTLLFVFAQMSSPEVNAHHSAHFSNASSNELLTTAKPVTMMADTLRFCTELGNAEWPASNQVYLGEGHPAHPLVLYISGLHNQSQMSVGAM